MDNIYVINGKHVAWHAIDNIHAWLEVGGCSCPALPGIEDVFDQHHAAVQAMVDARNVEGLSELIDCYASMAWALAEDIRNLGADPVERLHDMTIRGWTGPARPSNYSDGRLTLVHQADCDATTGE